MKLPLCRTARTRSLCLAEVLFTREMLTGSHVLTPLIYSCTKCALSGITRVLKFLKAASWLCITLLNQLSTNEGLVTWPCCSSTFAVYSGKQKLLRWIWVSETIVLGLNPLCLMEINNASVCIKQWIKRRSSGIGMLITNVRHFLAHVH